MSKAREHRLEGMEPDNLLAFLALLGLLRSLETAGTRPRAYWQGTPLRPVLSLPEAMTQEEVADLAAQGCRSASEAFCFVAGEFSFTEERLAKLYESIFTSPPNIATRIDAALSTYIVEGAKFAKATKESSEKHFSKKTPVNGKKSSEKHVFKKTPLNCLGKGRTDLFLALGDALDLCNQLDLSNNLKKALFMSWRREHYGNSLRWDYADDRRHAYTFVAPTREKARQEWGANLLALIGSSVMLGGNVIHGSSNKPMSLGTRVGRDGAYEISWPIWYRHASLATIQVLLGHPEFSKDKPDVKHLKQAAISTVFRSKKLSPNNYDVFSRAEAVA